MNGVKYYSRWVRLLPVAFITYSLAYLDRANFGFGAAGGMAEDLHIGKGTSSLLGALFFLGYFFFQIPGAKYAADKSARRLIFWALILWGMLAVVTGLVSNIILLAIVRFLLGVVESAVFPSLIILLSRWFARGERSRANSILFLGNPGTILWMSILSGYLVDAVGWRGMFVIEGVPAILWAFFWWKLVDDRPSDASWLNPADRKTLEDELQLEQSRIAPVKNYLVAFRSRSVVLLSVQYAAWSMGVYGFVMWLPSIIKSAPGTTMIMTGWLSSLPFVVAIVAMLLSSHFSDKTGRRGVYIWPSLLIASIAFCGSYWLGSSNFWLSFAMLCVAAGGMYAPYGPFFAMITEILPGNVSAGAIALVNSCGALGAFAGAYLVGFLNGETGNFDLSFALMAASLVISSAVMFSVPDHSTQDKK